MIKKGDLVKPVKSKLSIAAGIAVTDQYLTTFVHRDKITGKPNLTEEKIVIDIILQGKVIKKVPIDQLEKLTT